MSTKRTSKGVGLKCNFTMRFFVVCWEILCKYFCPVKGSVLSSNKSIKNDVKFKVSVSSF